MNGRDLVAGVDSSTQSAKVELRRLDDGEVVAAASAPHPTTTPPVSEQDPEAWWLALVEAFGDLGEARSDVVALAVAGQQHGLVLIDAEGVAVRPAKLWNDTTSADQADSLVAELGEQRWAESCGSVPVASFTVTKLAWVAEHEPEVVRRADRLMLPHDYLTWRLTGRHVTDRGDASGTGWFDPAADRYLPELLGAALGDTPPPALPEVLAPFAAVDTLAERAAEALGLPAGVVVGPGTGDNMAAALGLGLRPGEVVVSLGTSGTVYSVADSVNADASGAVAGFADATGRRLPLVCTLNATKVTDAVAQWLGTDAAGLGELAMQAEPVAPAPLLVPFFDGERTPNLPHATGTFADLRTDTSIEHLALGAHDGVLCGLIAGIEALTDAGVDTGGRVHLVGGGSRSVAYRQRAADLLARDIVVHADDETVAAGAAVQAAAVHGNVDAHAIADRWGLGVGTEVTPRETTASTERRNRYRALVADLYG